MSTKKPSSSVARKHLIKPKAEAKVEGERLQAERKQLIADGKRRVKQHLRRTKKQREFEGSDEGRAIAALLDDLEDAKKQLNRWLAMGSQDVPTEVVLWDEEVAKLRKKIAKLNCQVEDGSGRAGTKAPQRNPSQRSPAAEEWHELARETARQIIQRQAAQNLYPSQLAIADEIAAGFRKHGINGADGKPLSGAYIKRHALKGISSARKRELSTAPKRGK